MGLTQAEAGLEGNAGMIPMPILEQRVFMLNQKAMVLATALAQFKSRILGDVLACQLFTTNHPLLLDHVLREAKFYLRTLTRLQNREDIVTEGRRNMILSLFICHGSPEIAIENNEYTRLLGALGEHIKPKAIVIFTAHWKSYICFES